MDSGAFKNILCSNFTAYFDKEIVLKKVLSCENTFITFKTVSNT